MNNLTNNQKNPVVEAMARAMGEHQMLIDHITDSAYCSVGGRYLRCGWKADAHDSRDIEDQHREHQAAAALAAGLPLIVGPLRKLHHKEFQTVSDETWDQNPRCSECETSWPCETAALLDALSNCDTL